MERSPGRRAPGPSASGPQDAQNILDFYTCFLKVVRFLKLYPSAHPFIYRAFEDLKANWQHARVTRKRLGFESHNGSIYLDRTELYHAPRALEPLRKLLEDKQIDAIWVTPATPFGELRDLAELLAQTDDDLFRRDDFDPNRLVGLRNVHIARGRANVPGASGPEPPTTLSGHSFAVPNHLMDALSTSLDRGAIEARLGAENVVQLATSLLDRSTALPSAVVSGQPNLLAHGLVSAVSQLVPNANDPTADELGTAFAFCLEQLVEQRIDGAGYERAREIVLELMAPFDPVFVQKLMPAGRDGQPDPDHLLRRFSAEFKLRILEAELASRIERTRLKALIGTLARTEAEESELIDLLGISIETDPRLADDDRNQRIVHSLPRAGRRRASILVVDPVPDDGIDLRRALSEEDADVHLLLDPTRFGPEMERVQPDVVVIEPKLRAVSGLELIAELRRAGGDHPLPLIVYSEEESFRHDFEIGTYPNARYVLKSEGSAAVVDHVQQLLLDSDPAARVASPVGDVLRPCADVGNRSFTVPGFEIATLHAQGDGTQTVYFDVGPIEGDRSALVFAGGFRAADGPANAKMRGRLRAAMAEPTSPKALLSAINEVLHVAFDQRPLISTISMFVNGGTGDVECVLAGAPRPLRRPAEGTPHAVAVTSGIVLGFSQSQVFEASLAVQSIALDPGDTLLVYSHGLGAVAGGGDDAVGARELQRELALAGASPDELIERLRQLVAEEGTETAVDKAAIAIRRIPTASAD